MKTIKNVAPLIKAYGWQVVQVGDANDLRQLHKAYGRFLVTHDRPTLIIVQSHIGYGAPHKQDTAAAHGEALGVEEVLLTKAFLGCEPKQPFHVPKGVKKQFENHFGLRGSKAYALWSERYVSYQKKYPDLAQQIELFQHRSLPKDWDAELLDFPPDAKGLSTRDSSGQVLNHIAHRIPWLLGGAADLSPSTKTELKLTELGNFQAPEGAQNGNYRGRNFHFGLREHAMCAIGNGMSLSGLRPYVASFLVFTDYGRAALRLSAMMKLPLIGIWTHDSIGLGEDGPTHQPIEQLASFRAMPNMLVLRPADANEVVEAWKVIMQLKDSPVCLVLSRQRTPTFDRTSYISFGEVFQGAYVFADAPDHKPEVLLLATGTELSLCLRAYERLTAKGIKTRVVSMPCWELFEGQTAEYRDSVLPPTIRARVAVEQASGFGWERYTGLDGRIIAMTSFGMSAPGKVVEQHFGFDPEHIVRAAQAQIAVQRRQSLSTGVKNESAT